MTPALRLAGRKVSQTGSAAEAQHAPPVNSDDSLDFGFDYRLKNGILSIGWFC